MMELPKEMLVSFQPKVKPAEATVVLASKVMALTISSQSMELEAGIWSSVPQEKVPLAQRSLAVAELQEERPEPIRVVKLASAPLMPLVISSEPAKELEPVPSTKSWPSISTSPEIIRSLVVVMAALPAAVVPNLE